MEKSKMDDDECYDQYPPQYSYSFSSSSSTSYEICNNKIIITEYLQLLDTIIKNILYNLHYYDYSLIEQIKEKFDYYYKISETKNSLLNHPIHFMHLAFYEVYASYFYHPLSIHSFNKYFIKYQKFSEYKYNLVIIQLFQKIKNYKSIDNLGLEIEKLMLS
jgi:hypothetical protein